MIAALVVVGTLAALVGLALANPSKSKADEGVEERPADERVDEWLADTNHGGLLDVSASFDQVVNASFTTRSNFSNACDGLRVAVAFSNRTPAISDPESERLWRAALGHATKAADQCFDDPARGTMSAQAMREMDMFNHVLKALNEHMESIGAHP